MKNLSLFIFTALMALLFISPDKAYSADKDKPYSGYKPRTKGPQKDFHPEDYVDVNDPKSLWYGYGKKANREFDGYAQFAVPTDPSIISRDYNRKAIPHIKNMAKYCNTQWRGQKCMKILGALAVELTKDYMKKIYYSKTVPADLKSPSQKMLRETCDGILIKTQDEIIPLVMSDNLKKCINAINYVSKMTEVYPDRDLRQLTISSTFCIIRQPQCALIEKQLYFLVARPKIQDSAQAAPVSDNKKGE